VRLPQGRRRPTSQGDGVGVAIAYSGRLAEGTRKVADCRQQKELEG